MLNQQKILSAVGSYRFLGLQNIRNILIAGLHKDAESEESDKTPAWMDDDISAQEPLPENFFNKSRLRPGHRKMLFETRPYDQAESWIHLTEKYQRKLYGRYGEASKVNPRICYPTKSDVKEQREYEKFAYPHTLQEMIKINLEDKKAKRAAILKRDEDIAKKLEKLEHWKKDLSQKIAKKEAEANKAKERKERLVEEVRRHFGFKIDPRDEKFKTLLEQKDREDRKKQKEAKRKMKDDKLMAKLVENVSEKK